MTDAPILFTFIDYLCARRGITREAALELITRYMAGRAAVQADNAHPIVIESQRTTQRTP
jgi:hypothetical protein